MAAIVKRRPLPAAWQPFNVKDYGATGDGTTSDQVAVALAVSRAYAAGAFVDWPPGTYLTTANVPNLHDVRHRGPGVIKRGSTTFYPDPKNTQSNKLWVSTSGSTSNDGITSSEPMTLARSAAVLLAYSDRGLPGKWTVEGAAGTYTERWGLDSYLWPDYPITLKGPDVGGHPNEPTMKINMTGTPTTEGVDITGQAWVIIQDVKVINASSGTGFATGSGALVQLTNCHTDNCLRAILNQHSASVTVRGGDYDGNGLSGSYGYASFYNATHSIEGATGTSDAPRFHNFTYGMFISEGAQGHIDYCNLTDNDVGLWLSRSAGACNTKNLLIQRNGVGVQADNQWFNNNITFGTGGDANTVNVRTYGNAPEFDYRNIDYGSKTPRQQVRLAAQSAHTGTTSKTAIWTLTDIIRPWMVSEAGDYIELDMYLEASLGSGGVGLIMDINNGGADDLLTTLTIPSATTDIWLKVVIVFTDSNQQRCFMKATLAPAFGTDCADTGSGVVDFMNTGGTVKLSAQLGASGDSVTPLWGRCITTLGG